MDCTNCSSKTCRSIEACKSTGFNPDEVKDQYHHEDNQQVIRAAANLVDNGRAGTLNRLQEIVEFIRLMGYQKPGLAYCYGMEEQARQLKEYFKGEGLKLVTISCTVGGMAQDELNDSSCIHKVSCNPLGQAQQLEEEGVDFVIIMGICLGHDILLHRNLKVDFTTFVVKDRVLKHRPLSALDRIIF
jgi:uncharacterized metal-binding protein